MQADLVCWINSHLAWLQKILAHILDKKKLGIEDYLGTLVSEGAPIDEIGILIFSQMYDIHVCVLLKGYFWTTNENEDQDQCHLTLVYQGALVLMVQLGKWTQVSQEKLVT